jgi:hypothetical protein
VLRASSSGERRMCRRQNPRAWHHLISRLGGADDAHGAASRSSVFPFASASADVPQTGRDSLPIHAVPTYLRKWYPLRSRDPSQCVVSPGPRDTRTPLWGHWSEVNTHFCVMSVNLRIKKRLMYTDASSIPENVLQSWPAPQPALLLRLALRDPPRAATNGRFSAALCSVIPLPTGLASRSPASGAGAFHTIEPPSPQAIGILQLA